MITRELFERFATAHGWINELYMLERVDNGAYLDLYLELRW